MPSFDSIALAFTPQALIKRAPQILMLASILLTSRAERAHCDVSESGPGVRLARSLQPAQLQRLYTDGIWLMDNRKHERIAANSPMPSSYAELRPQWLEFGPSYASAKLGGCIDAAVFLSVERDEGMSLSWGEFCSDCRQYLWRVPRASKKTETPTGVGALPLEE